MAELKEQNFANHTRYVPMYHFVLFGIILLNLVWSVYRIVKYYQLSPVQEGMRFLIAFALAIFFVFTRQFAMTLQDRIIRLEMHIRLEKLLGAEMRPRIKDLTLDQLIALRFAGDDELPALTAKVLNEKITDRKLIKQMIKKWNPDHLRA